ncbi:carboxy terminal-processing peptidase [Paucibacter sp. B2R-40]|uniref:carboxy terminal-processing peptidase n=1 Tax=Paucibacter sp. B2R-40 TaxID=2893554 RepID=UPI0021E42F0B|nr:carboxy terminal-processing peptidase [Paucibacter sp. B2R-40]MCV2354359.1 carboxy terminal-processing peptidase [Paucibacter sp. B2R-40]
MKKKSFVFLISLGLALSSFAAVPETLALLKPLPQQGQAATMSAQILTRHHYKAQPLDDAMSEKIFDRYLKSLDPEKLFFLQSDIDQFAAARTKMDDAIGTQDLATPFAMFNLYQKRAQERMIYARELLDGSFDFTEKESYRFSREKEPWIKTESEMRDLWRQRVKNDWLRLKLAGTSDKVIKTTLAKRYDNSLSRMNKLKSEDVFQLFMNAYAMSVEPHTNYLGPRASEAFDISMRLSLVGIGAVLQERDELITIRELVPGGPAARSGKLKVGDRIVGVGQGADSTPIDVIGWRLDDAVDLIRGKKDTVVVLNILPAAAGPDGKPQTLSLVRNKISMEQQSAKKSIMDIKQAATTRRIGVITLPTFYQDFEARARGDKDFKSVTRDVARLLAELKKEKVDGVMIDLRDNGGGSLAEAVELTSLFIGKGPVVQQRNSSGDIRVESESGATAAWDGPLAVLINRGSASASEIFAAAIQDYGRGIILGESSFGKGTVQTMINLDKMDRSVKLPGADKPKYGELKMTVAQFFRVNGGTTQLRGVSPDIGLASFSDNESFGESSYDNALPWVQIKPANYQVLGDMKELLPLLQIRHESRVAKDRDYQLLLDDIKDFNVQRKVKLVSLNEVERRAERDARALKTKEREAARLADKGKGDKKTTKAEQAAAKLAAQDDGLQANERSLADELAAEQARKDTRDVLLDEAAHVLGDAVDLLQSNLRLADQVTPGLARKNRAAQ